MPPGNPKACMILEHNKQGNVATIDNMHTCCSRQDHRVTADEDMHVLLVCGHLATVCHNAAQRSRRRLNSQRHQSYQHQRCWDCSSRDPRREAAPAPEARVPPSPAATVLLLMNCVDTAPYKPAVRGAVYRMTGSKNAAQPLCCRVRRLHGSHQGWACIGSMPSV